MDIKSVSNRKVINIVMAIAFFLILTSSPVWAQVGRPSKIFYVNLYPDLVDVRLGDSENYVFKGEGLKPNSVTYYSETTDFGDYFLYFKLSSEEGWIKWVDEEGYQYNCPVEPGELHSIIIGPDGSVDYYSLTADRNPGTKICFINGADAQLSKMEVGVEFGDDNIAYIDDFSPMEISNFVTASSGVYSLFWQFPSQKVNEDYYYYPNNSGDGYELFDFEEGKYYVFFVYTVSRDDYAALYDITPDY